MKRTIALLVALFAAAPASAAQHWKVDSAKSKLGFSVSWSAQPFVGVFRSWKADIDFDPADLAHSHALITIDLGSETSSDPETDDGIKGAEGFAASQFPTATFRTTAFTHKSGDQYVAAGTLSIKGISRAITLPFTLTLSGNAAHVAGKAQVIRTDFEVGTGEWAKPDPVARAVTVSVDLTATKG
jgi:polyisoprenoid-binding protein YceI